MRTIEQRLRELECQPFEFFVERVESLSVAVVGQDAQVIEKPRNLDFRLPRLATERTSGPRSVRICPKWRRR